MTIRPSVRTIPAGAPFLATLVQSLVDGALLPGFTPRADPLSLSDATIFLPTRRSIRTIREVFLEVLGGDAVILPRLLALGEVDDDEAAFDAGPEGLVLPEAVGRLERQVELTRLVLRWAEGVRTALLPVPGRTDPLLIPASAGDAARLATTLARFMDGLENERIPFSSLEALRGEHGGRYDRYFDITLEFLSIVTRHWPAYLSDRGVMDPVARRNRLLEGAAARFGKDIGGGPVIIAGSTGSIPATRDLIVAVARRPGGVIVLPGLDTDLDDAGWQAIPADREDGAPSHPQAGLQALLHAIGIDRQDVATLGEVAPQKAARTALVSQALRPAATTHAWVAEARPSDADLVAALAGVSVIEAQNESEEALAIALVLREALETRSQRVALVTPDRALAGRVVAELARWDIVAADSAGRPLLVTPQGVFARMVLDAALSDFDPVALLALLKHPLCSLSLDRPRLNRGIVAFEIGALRGPQPPPGLGGLRTALDLAQHTEDRHAPSARTALTPEDWDAARIVLDRLEGALGRFAAVLGGRVDTPAAVFFAAHTEAILAAADRGRFGSDESGETFVGFLDELATIRPEALSLPPAAYPGLFAALAEGRSVRGGDPPHPRLAIYGLLEARLIPADLLVLAGLDEGVWPAGIPADPWLNRPMRAALGLPPPERRIGLAAHDFSQGLGADRVVLTRARKRGGSPTVPARWLQRLAAYAGEPAFKEVLERGSSWLDLASALDAPAGPVLAVASPAPRPVLDLRPRRLSVTQIEDLLRDPYSIYARHILRLDVLPEIAEPPGASDRGTLIHAAIERFSALCGQGLPPDAEARLNAIFDDVFAPFAGFADVAAFWMPRLRRMARFLVGWEANRRPDLDHVAAEIRGRIAWTTVAGRLFELRAEADRLERLPDGRVRIIDFKTGTVPSVPQVLAGFAPQLPLEAAIVLEGGFPGFGAGDLDGMAHVALNGSREGGSERPVVDKTRTTAEIARHTLERLKQTIDRFEDEATAYRSHVSPLFKRRRYGDYDHLARVREWSLASDEAGEDADA